MKKMHAGLALIAAALLVLQGCSGDAGVREEGAEVPVDERSVGLDEGYAEGTGAQEGVQTGTAQMGSGMFEGRPINEVLNDPQSELAKRVFYFEFNSSELSAADRAALEAHARMLNANPEVSVVLEGHADERGSREYNLALGERRAKAIEQVLSLLGVAAEQIQVISFGEERPVALGHDDEAWRLNRRVELLYSGY